MKAKASPKKRVGARINTKQCFACDEVKKGNSKFCAHHHPMMESIKNQAKKAGEVEAFNHMFTDEAKCRASLAQFEKDNPSGKKFRKKLIEWYKRKKDFAVKVSKERRRRRWMRRTSLCIKPTSGG